MAERLRMGVIGIDHRHIYTMVSRMQEVGAELAGWWTEGTPPTLSGFVERFPRALRVDAPERLLDDPSIGLILTAAVPADRAGIAIAAMRAGKDVMTDKPGCTTLEDLGRLRAAVAETGRIWSVNFSERFEVPAVTRALELVEEGAIGAVVEVLGLGPHRLNRATRPPWFFERARYGGILTDIASHQIDQFLAFTGAQEAEIEFASVANLAHPEDPELQDFGQVALRAGPARGYVRVDWFTPDGLPTWGDGRLFVTGTEGTLELRKYVDVAGRAGTDHLFLVTRAGTTHIDASGAGLPYFPRFAADLRDRTETAMAQDHAFAATDLALRAQAMAEARC